MRATFIVVLTFWLVLIAAPETTAEDLAVPSGFQHSALSPQAGNSSWPITPGALDGWDWIQLDTGEWLKGEIIGLYDKSLTFDSDYFDELSFDWSDDVIRVLSSQSMAVRLSSGATVWGPVDIDATTLRFAGPVNVEYLRSDIVAMSRRGEREIDRWRLSIALAGTLKSGNTSERSLTSKFALTRYTSKSVVSLSYRGDYSETADVLTEESHRFSSRMDRFLARQLYWTPGYFDYFRDRSQNIDARITYSIFVGYYLLDTPHVTWKIGGGPGYQYQEYTTAPVGQDLSRDTGVISAESDLEWDINSEVTLSLLYQPQFSNDATGRYKHLVDAALTVDLTEKLDFELSYLWDYTERPQRDEDGVVPQQDDYTITMGLKWSY